MMRALYSGVAGLKTHQGKMDVIGNNIANVNTVGFKSSSVVFSDLLYQTTSGASGANQNIGGINAKQVGLGAKQASTNISITAGGANQTTGGAFDLKLNDGSTTNFFIVNDGTSNYFTRAGAFTVDAAGNLVMASNGYYVMGWQVNSQTGEIQKNTVSKLQINGPSTQTSPPEATKEATVTGVLDKNDKDVNADEGYAMNLNFYDSLGYSYTAKFAAKAVDVDNGIYTVELANIYTQVRKSNGKTESVDILVDYIKDYIEKNGGTEADAKASLFGAKTNVISNYEAKEPYFIDGGVLKYKDDGGTEYTATGGVITTPETIADPNDPTQQIPNPDLGKIDFGAAGKKSVLEVYGVTINKAISANPTIDAKGNLVLTEERAGGTMVFDIEDKTGNGNGSLIAIDTSGGTLVVDDLLKITTTSKDQQQTTFKAHMLTEYGAAHRPENPQDPQRVFSDINVDFSTVLNYDNEGTSSMGMNRGALDGMTGLGKALGALIGLSVDSAGCIYGSYDNGNTELLGQIPVAQFANPAGLEAVGSSLFKQTLNSGDFDGIGVDVTADGGGITTGTLEMSNVDLSTEFTDMITTQRGFQANSRIITTSDSLLEELINLKR